MSITRILSLLSHAQYPHSNFTFTISVCVYLQMQHTRLGAHRQMFKCPVGGPRERLHTPGGGDIMMMEAKDDGEAKQQKWTENGPGAAGKIQDII